MQINDLKNERPIKIRTKKVKTVLGVIPARLDSKRFPDKVIQPILEKPMIHHVYSQAKKSKLLHDIIVATDSSQVVKVCENLSIPVILTSHRHQSGTERLIEVSQRLKRDIYVDIQGDEPLIQGSMIDSLIYPFIDGDYHGITTLKYRLTNQQDLVNPHIVKVVCNQQDEALSFYRSPIIHPVSTSHDHYYKHIGIYAYPMDILEQIAHLPPSNLEKKENLEQLRFLENRIPIKVIESPFDTIGVDVPDDLLRVEKHLKEKIIGVNGKKADGKRK